MKLIALVALLSLTGCVHGQLTPKAQQVFSCLTPAEGDVFTAIAADVEKAMVGSPDTWVADLEGVALKDGIDAVVCVLDAIMTKTPTATALSPSAAKAKQWLESHNITVLHKKS